MGQDLIRLLKADEIECRVAAVNEKGLSLLLYKDARVDQRILDESFGPFGWKRSHQSIDGNLYCTVEIRDSKSGEWIGKQDVGTTGYTEKEKSQASDSFKRACFNWGIGRELYSAPFIWVPAGKAAIRRRDNKYCCNDRFSVKSISYNGNREINALAVVNGRDETVYEMRAKAAADGGNNGTQASRTARTQSEPQGSSLSKTQIASLQAELDRTGVTLEDVRKRYEVREPEMMNEETYNKVMLALSRTKSAKAA